MIENIGPFGLPLSFVGTASIVALALVVWVVGRRILGPAAGWAALALAGQACALQLVLAGPRIRLQGFWGWNQLLKGPRIVFLLAVVLQAAVVAWGLRPYLRHRHALLSLLSWPKWIALAFLLAYSASSLPPELAPAIASGDVGAVVTRFAGHASKFMLSMFLLACGFFNLLLATVTMPDWVWQRTIQWWRKQDPRWLPWAAALWVVFMSSFLGWSVLQRVPHIGDELAYLFQAKYLALGQLSLPLPPDRDAFQIPFTYSDPMRWINAVPIGWPALLAVGVRAGVPWLVNPVLGGIAVLLAHALVRRTYSRTHADVLVLLLAASPWLLWMSAGLMTHAASLVLVLLVLLGCCRARDDGALMWAGVAGLACGLLLQVRPLEAVVTALVGGGWWLTVGPRKLEAMPLVAAVLGGLATTSLYLAYNYSVTGDAFSVPLNVHLDRLYGAGVNRLGFGPEVGNMGWLGLDALPGHGPIDVFMNTNQNLHLVQFDLFGWTFGSLTLAYLLGVWKPLRRDALMWSWVIAVIIVLNLYWFSGGSDYGARYWYFAIVPFAILTLRGAEEVSAHLAARGLERSRLYVVGLVLLATLAGTTNVMVWRSLDKYFHYRGSRDDVRNIASSRQFRHSLVFIRGRSWPDYGSAAPFNPAVLDPDGEAPVFALERSPESVARVRSFFSDRPAWILAGPDRDVPKFRIVAGPIAPGEPMPAAPIDTGSTEQDVALP